MKKIITYILVLVVITFTIPFLFTRVSVQGNSNLLEQSMNSNKKIEDNGNSEQLDTPNYSYKNFNTIKILHTKTNTIEELHLDEYLYGVVSAEMPADYDIEALKAQAIVARTYTVYKIMENESKHGEAHICDNSACCQAWISKQDRLERWDEDKREENWNKIVSAVNETKGKIITYQGKPINAFFHSNSGGVTETPVNVWGGTGYPYLQVVETAGEDWYEQYSSEVEISTDDLITKMKQRYPDFEIDFQKEDCVKIVEYTAGNRVKTVKIGNHNLSGVEARTIFSLKSANFEVEVNDEKVKFKVKGYGHGVGMSQTGADSLAKQGLNCEEIIKHFYVGVDIDTKTLEE